MNEALVFLRAGWDFAYTDRPTRKSTIHLVLVYTLVLVLVTLLPGFQARVVGRPAADIVTLALPAGLGFLLGVWIVGRYGHRLDPDDLGSGGLMLAALAVMIMAIWQSESAISILTLALLFVGFSLALVIIPSRAVLQSRPPVILRGRVWATQVVLSNTTALLPIIVCGALADRIGIRPVLLLIALATLFVGVAVIPE